MLYKIIPLLLVAQLVLLTCLFSQTNEQLRANLYTFNTDSTLSLNDGNLTMYNINNSNAVDGMDAMKMANFGENFGLARGAKTLAIERRQSITVADTTFFKMWNMRQKNYKMLLFLTGLAHPDLNGVLEDKYLNTSTALHLNGSTSIVFSVTKDIASAAADRFRIVFSLTGSLKVLPITYTNVKAYQDNLPNGHAGNNIHVEWSAENEKEVAQYKVERSLNGKQFFTLFTIDLKGNGVKNYKWTDSSATKGNNFYRINSIDINGKTQYSDVIRVSIGAAADNSFSIYPNTVVNGLINIHFTNQPKGNYLARLINNYGQVILQTQLVHDGVSRNQTIQLNNNAAKGIYILELSTPANKLTGKLFIQ